MTHPFAALGQQYVLRPERTATPAGFVPDQAVVVDGERLAWVGSRANLPPEYANWASHELAGHAVTPGFVDAHQHLTQSFGSTYAYGEPSEIFRRVWVPLEEALTEEDVGLSVRLAALESMRGGFTTVAEAGTRSRHDVGIVAEAAREAGLRTVLGLICHDVGDAAPSSTEVIRQAERHLARYEHDAWVRPSISVATPQMATGPTLSRLAGLCREAGAVLQSHVNEHLASVESSLLSVGARPMEYLDEHDALGPWLLAAHTALLTPAEMTLMRDRDVAWSYNPVASAWKGNAVADALQLLDRGVRTGLGTDGTRGDAFRLMDAAETAARLTSAMGVGDPFAGEGRTWWHAATAGGASAVGLAGQTGAVTTGAAADLLLLDLRRPELTPSHDLAWDLVRVGARDQVRAVITGGAVRLIDGRPVDGDTDALLEEAGAAAVAAADRAGLRARRAR